MSYKLVFDPRALKEWHKLGETVKAQFKKKLAYMLAAPGRKSARLSGLPDCYNIKLRTSGYRLVYQVRDDVVCVLAIAIGKRENLTVYQGAGHRLE
ncbi:type II toxin-antitoxin system RelE/ParE family toxin [Cronobacter malonaticus]